MKTISILGIICILFLFQVSLYSSVFEEHNKNPGTYQTSEFISHDYLLSYSLPPLLSNGGSSRVNYPNKAIFLNFTPGYSRIYNKDIYIDEYWDAKGGFGYNAELGYIFKLKPIVAFGIGLGLSSYQATLRVDTYTEQMQNFIDIDGDILSDYSQTLFDIFQKTTIKYFDLPIFIEIGNPNIDRVGYYAKIGVKLSLPLSDSYLSHGHLSSSGYYEIYSCFVEGVDAHELGLFDNYSIDKPWENDLKSFNVSAIASAGISLPLSNLFILKFGANINLGLTEISAEKESNFENMKYNGDYNSLLVNPNNKTTVQSCGIEVGLIYVLSVK